MTKSYFEEFEKKYNRPRMNDITVGFSGIDPEQKTNEAEIIEIINNEFQSFDSIDCGEIL